MSAAKTNKKKKVIKHEFLRSLRKQSGETQEFFSKMLGVVPSQYCRKEQGESKFTFNECQIIKTYLNNKLKTSYTIEEIFTEEPLEVSA